MPRAKHIMKDYEGTMIPESLYDYLTRVDLSVGELSLIHKPEAKDPIGAYRQELTAYKNKYLEVTIELPSNDKEMLDLVSEVGIEKLTRSVRGNYNKLRKQIKHSLFNYYLSYIKDSWENDASSTYETILNHTGLIDYVTPMDLESYIKDSKITRSKETLSLIAKNRATKVDYEHKEAARKETVLKRYGVDSVMKVDSIKEKLSKINKAKLEANPELRQKMADRLHTKEARDKAKATTLANYGVENPFQSEKVKQKIAGTNIERYGYTSPNSNKEIKAKGTKTWYENNVKSFQFNPTDYVANADEAYSILNNEYKLKAFLSTIGEDKVTFHELANLLGLNYSTITSNHANTLYSWGIIKSGHRSSSHEDDLYNFIVANYSGNIVRHDRKVLSGLELDIYLPDINLAIEFNGIYWHSLAVRPKNYHEDKVTTLSEKGINTFMIWEDDWVNKQDIIKSMLSYKLGNAKINHLYARKTKVSKATSKESISFYEANHIQGGLGITGTTYKLTYEGSDVAMMTFNKTWRTGEDEWELTRFASKLDFSIAGGASKLLKAFEREMNPSKLISYANGNFAKAEGSSLYSKLGFTKVSRTRPMYYWADSNYNHISRYKVQPKKLAKKYPNDFRKDNPNETEVDFMTRKGYNKIETVGNDKYIKTYK